MPAGLGASMASPRTGSGSPDSSVDSAGADPEGRQDGRIRKKDSVSSRKDSRFIAVFFSRKIAFFGLPGKKNPTFAI